MYAPTRSFLGDFTAVWLPYRNYRLHLALPAQIVVVGFPVTVLWSNFSGVPGFPYRLPGQLREVRDTLALNQKWNMFAPSPSVVDGWYVVRGETRAGTAVDVLRNRVGEPNFTRPKDLGSQYPNYRWRKYLTRLAFAPNKSLRASFARYLCRSWDQGKPESDRLASVKIYFNMERIELNDNPRPVNRVLLHEQLCGAPTPLRSDHLPSLQGQEEDPL